MRKRMRTVLQEAFHNNFKAVEPVNFWVLRTDKRDHVADPLLPASSSHPWPPSSFTGRILTIKIEWFSASAWIAKIRA